MRAVLVGPYPVDPHRIRGGVEASFVNLVAGLAATPGVDLDVVSFVRGAASKHVATHGPVPITYLPGARRFNNATLYRRDRQTLAGALERLGADVVHAQDALGYGYTCLRADHQAPVVVSIHGIVREERKHLPRIADRVRTSIARIEIERYCVGHARYLVQPTRYPGEYFGNEIHGDIVDVGNPISDRFFAVEPDPEPGRLFYSGAIMQRKRLLDLVEALAQVRAIHAGVKVRVAGEPSDAPYAAAVRARVAALGLERQVVFLGGIGPEDLAEEYRRASIYVLPSGQETSPMGIGEAMAAGVPTIATRTGGVPYLVDDGRTGFVTEVGDVSGLAGRIVELLGDDELSRSMGAEARADAEIHFRGTAVAARVLEVYRAAVEGRS